MHSVKYVDYLGKKRIESAFYNPKSKLKTWVGIMFETVQTRMNTGFCPSVKFLILDWYYSCPPSTLKRIIPKEQAKPPRWTTHSAGRFFACLIYFSATGYSIGFPCHHRRYSASCVSIKGKTHEQETVPKGGRNSQRAGHLQTLRLQTDAADKQGTERDIIPPRAA